MRAFLFVLLATFLDILANIYLKKCAGFRHKLYGIVALVLVNGAFVALGFALVSGVQLSIAYSTWGGIGILGTSLASYVVFKEPLGRLGLVGMGLMLVSVVLLNT